jgi:dTDP-4-dehydrorhamnose reductase
MLKILVTGSNGLLGQKLIAQLLSTPGVHPVATARKPLAQGPEVEFHLLDVTLENHVHQVIGSVKPDVVIHTAAMTNVDHCEKDQVACWLSNVTAVQHLVSACNAHQFYLIHLSTDFIFDGTEGPLDETAVPHPVNYYGKSKLAAEQHIQQFAHHWCILRTILVYGVTPDMSRSNLVLWVKKSLEEKKTISVVNDQFRTPTLAEDLANGCTLAALKKATGIFNISGKDLLTLYDMAVQTAQYFGLDASLIQPTDSIRFTQPAVRPLRTGFSIEKARQHLGYEPHSFQEGLALLAQQLRLR